jgi:membrane-bound metal-dependent hydrolase YbcI (DUF457 family)
LAKGCAYERFSLTAFLVSQVVIDTPVAFRLFSAQPEWPFHRWEHSLIVATALGIAAGLAVWRFGWRWPGPETSLKPALVGGVFGGVTHPILDSLVHDDVMVWWPFVTGPNALLDAIPWTLHLRLIAACTLVGGLLIIRRRRRAARPLLDR